MRDEQLHAVVARSAFRSQNVQSTPMSEHSWKLKCWKSARRCGGKHASESKCTKHTMFGPLSEVDMSKKCTLLWREAHFQVKSVKNWRSRSTFGSWHVEKVHAVVAQSTFRSQKCKKMRDTEHFRVVGTRDCAPCHQWAKHEGFVAVSKTMAGVGHLKRMWTVAGAVQETHELDVLGDQGAVFLRGFAFWSIRSSVWGRWFSVTGAALCMTGHHFFVAGAMLQRHGLEKSQNALVRGRQLCTQLSIIEGSLAELLCFWCCQLQKVRRSRRIASFSSLQMDR